VKRVLHPLVQLLRDLGVRRMLRRLNHVVHQPLILTPTLQQLVPGVMRSSPSCHNSQYGGARPP
jgi:hypothetical protein